MVAVTAACVCCMWSNIVLSLVFADVILICVNHAADCGDLCFDTAHVSLIHRSLAD